MPRGNLRGVYESTRLRSVDAGHPLLVEHESSGSFLLTMRACSDPRCTCTTVDLELVACDPDDTTPPVRIGFDVAKREPTGLSDPAGLLAGNDAWLRARLVDDIGGHVADRFARMRASKDRRVWQGYDWSSHVAGDMIAFYELFPHDWDLCVTASGRNVWVTDLYCVRASCSCQDIVLHLVDLETDGAIGDARVRLAGRDRITVKDCPPTARPLVEAALARPRVGALLHDRFREMRYVARRLKTWRGDLSQPEATIETLLTRRAPPDEDSIERVHALGERVVPALAAVVLDATSPTERRVRAARLLAAVDEPAAAPALAAALVWDGIDDDIEAVEDVIDALVRLRRHALEPVLDVLPVAGLFASRVVDVLADLRIPDERVVALIAERARHEPQLWCDALRWQGAAAEPVLRRILTDAVAVLPARCEDARAALDALEDLGAEVDSATLDSLEAAEAAADALAEQEHRRAEEAESARRGAHQAALAELERQARPGRNQACWCGSGEKYKKCHLANDDAERSALVARLSHATPV